MEHKHIYPTEQHASPLPGPGQNITPPYLYMKGPFQYHSLTYAYALGVAYIIRIASHSQFCTVSAL